MFKTYGLTHIALIVLDVEHSLRFYQQLFGLEAYFREEGRIHASTPGCRDVITFDQNRSKPEGNGGIIHFGFRLQSPDNLDNAVQEVERAGGKVLQQGEFAPGFPYLFITDPDGYEVEIWYE